MCPENCDDVPNHHEQTASRPEHIKRQYPSVTRASYNTVNRKVTNYVYFQFARPLVFFFCYGSEITVAPVTDVFVHTFWFKMKKLIYDFLGFIFLFGR